MNEDHFITFAYGSNMLSARLRERKRCPSAKPLCVAELNGFMLRWHKRSKDGSGKCDIVSVSSPKAHVFGVLYRVAVSERCALDKAEGLGKGYAKICINVVCKGGPKTAEAYQATDIDQSRRPYSWYRALVVAGAREHRLPEEYISQLEAVATQEDPDRVRHDRNMRLIREVRG